MKLNKHTFSGACAPGKSNYSCATFSVGIFQWVKASTRIGIKRGKVLVRVRGFSSDPEKVYEKAREIVDALDSGTYKGPKAVTI